MSPKGAKEAPKVNPKSIKIPQKIATSKKVEKGRPSALSFGVNFDIFLVKKCIKKSMRKTTQKNMSKNLKIKQKNRHDPIPKKEDSEISSAKADPRK